MVCNYLTKELYKDFPNLTYLNSKQTSEPNDDYNCIAWACEMNDIWLWPGENNSSSEWPNNIPRILNKTAFIKLFELFGYKILTDKNSSLEFKTQKIAIYIDELNKPTHAARQLQNGKWTSKIGRNLDIEHDNLSCLEGPAYGKVDIIMARRLR
jgi:hypothetical protein